MKYTEKISKHLLYTLSRILVIVFGTVLILSTAFYNIFTGILKQKIYNSTKENLQQISYSVRTLSESVDNISKQLVYNSFVRQSMASTKFDAMSLYKCSEIIDSLRISYPMIHSIYIINDTGDVYSTDKYLSSVYTHENFFDNDLFSIIKDNGGLKQPYPRILTTKSSNYKDIQEKVYTFIFKSNYLEPFVVNQAIVINISSKWLDERISYMDINKIQDKETYILRKDGIVVCSNKDEYFLSDITDSLIYTKMIHLGETSGYFVDKSSRGNELFTVYVWSDYFDWCLVSKMPYKTILSEVAAMQRYTILISFLVTSISFIITLFLLKKINLPIKKAYEELEALETEHKQEFSSIKNVLFISLLSGKLHTNNFILLEKCLKDEKAGLDLNKSLLLIALVIDHYQDFRNNFSALEKERFSNEIKVIAAESLQKFRMFEVINNYDDKFIVIANYDNEEFEPADIQKDLFSDLCMFQTAVMDKLGIGLTISVGRVAHNYLDIPIYYDEVLQLSMKRFALGHHSIIFPNEEIEEQSDDLDYSALNEAPLLNAIASGKLEEAEKAYADIITNMKSIPFGMSRHLLNHLYFGIKAVCKSKDSSISLSEGYFIDIFNKLQTIETLSEAKALFLKLFNSLSYSFQDDQLNIQNQIVDKTKRFIQENYSKNILSATMIADEIKISAAYLGKLFKQFMNTSIPKYINDTRMNKSKELLENTEMSINEISEATGFSNSSYFYSVFKRETGVTPNQYRNDAKNRSG